MYMYSTQHTDDLADRAERRVLRSPAPSPSPRHGGPRNYASDSGDGYDSDGDDDIYDILNANMAHR
jgi:hypothetical protein